MRPAAAGACVAAAAGYAASVAAVRVRRQLRGGTLVALAAGGNGSHVFPALAIAQDLQRSGVQVVLLGEGPPSLESEVAQQSGLPLLATPSVQLRPPLRSAANLASVLRFPLCVACSAWALLRCAPDVLVGTGGRVEVPACLAAAALGIPLLLYEPNAKPGAANRALHWLACRTLLAYGSAAGELRFKERCQVVGPAVRSEVLAYAPPCDGGTAAQQQQQQEQCRRRQRCRARKSLGLPAGRGARVLLVLGGWRGCGYLNCALNNALPQLAGVPGLFVLWHTGAKQHRAYAEGYAASLPNVRCVPHLPDMGAALASADLVLSRAGAATVAELAACRTRALLMPSPATCEQQQEANARVLEERALRAVAQPPQVWRRLYGRWMWTSTASHPGCCRCCWRRREGG
ncbi:hypothetical protein Agub_g4905, partial [Astrephomene gubernaculifera]